MYCFLKINFSIKHEQPAYYKISNNEIISLSLNSGIIKIKILPQSECDKITVIDEIEFEEAKQKILNQLGV